MGEEDFPSLKKPPFEPKIRQNEYTSLLVP